MLDEWVLWNQPQPHFSDIDYVHCFWEVEELETHLTLVEVLAQGRLDEWEWCLHETLREGIIPPVSKDAVGQLFVKLFNAKNRIRLLTTLTIRNAIST